MAVLPTGIGPVTGYNIERSLRFNSANTAYLNRTPASAGNRKKWTWSGWVKKSTIGNFELLMAAAIVAGSSEEQLCFGFPTADGLAYRDGVSGNYTVTAAIFRDPSAWYHIVFVYDSANAAQADRGIFYINGIRQTATTNAIPLNRDSYINSATAHALGRFGAIAASYFNGYMTEVNFINGQVPTTTTRTVNGVTETILTQLGEFSSSTGVWTPKAWDGTYGTNGFYLKFADNSNTTAATLGKDSSGNGNNWTPNLFSVTAGVNNDSLVDSPTSYGTDTGVGGEVRGNYCTLNPLDNPNTTYAFSQNGNLYANLGSGAGTFLSGTMHVLGGKYYWECTPTSIGNGLGFGITYGSTTTTDANSKGIFYFFDGTKRILGTSSSYGASYAANDVIGIAVDGIAGTIEFFKNGTSQGVITNSSIALQQFRPIVFNNSSSAGSLTFCNFGQRPFEKWNGSAYVANTAPSGFKALCTQNLPTPTIGATSTTQANDYFDVTLYTGNGAVRSITNSGSMQPDFVWDKLRSGSNSHRLFDAVRGVEKALYSNLTNIEATETGTLTAFNSNGFSLGTSTETNTNGSTYVAWQWNAGGSTVTDTSGTISSQVRANTTSGFSIVTYTGTGANATVGHGLGATPAMIIVKNRDSGAIGGAVYHTSMGATKYLKLFQTTTGTDQEATDNTAWNGSSPTFNTNVFSVGSLNRTNSSQQMVAYCFAPVIGYSAFGSYTGNASADGPFVYLGFRPAYVLIKRSSATEAWCVMDSKREGYNVDNDPLFANLANAEGTQDFLDLLSNGFKLRSTDTGVNGSGTYIYACFAESPFKYSLAR